MTMLETGTDEEAEERQLERDRETHRYHTQDMLIARLAISKEYRDIGPGIRGRKWYQSIDILKLSGCPFFFFHFKGTPSREEHKTVPQCLHNS